MAACQDWQPGLLAELAVSLTSSITCGQAGVREGRGRWGGGGRTLISVVSPVGDGPVQSRKAGSVCSVATPHCIDRVRVKLYELCLKLKKKIEIYTKNIFV